MTWISLICLLALSSSVFGRSVPQLPTYGSDYGSKILTPRAQTYEHKTVGYNSYVAPVVTPSEPKYSYKVRPQTYEHKTVGYNSYGTPVVIPSEPKYSYKVRPQTYEHKTIDYNSYVAPVVTPSEPKVVLPAYGHDYSSMIRQAPVAPIAPVLTEFDILCRGRLPETVIPLDGNRRWVTCLDDSKGVVQECPRGLLFVESKRRCERPIQDDACAVQPCLNGGQCIPTEYSFQCQCPSGFGGFNCQLDTQVCERSFPCGSSSNVICQSFRLGAALDYVCVAEEGTNYGENGQLVHSNPCVGPRGPFKLAFTNKGFIMCDGDRMSIESCPGGTLWDDINKACTWPDMQPLPEAPRALPTVQYGESIPKHIEGYEQPMLPAAPKYSELPRKHILPAPKMNFGYGEQKPTYEHTPEILPTPVKVNLGYGEQKSTYEHIPKHFPTVPKAFPKYGGEEKVIQRAY